MTQVNLRNSQKYHSCSVTIDLELREEAQQPMGISNQDGSYGVPTTSSHGFEPKTEGSVPIAVMEK